MDTKEQHELYEAARKRVKQKKRLYFHFVLFLIGSVFFVIANKYLNIYPEYDWFLWAIIVWLFFLVIDTINVLIIKRFFGEEWERKETEKLLAKHDKKVEKLEKKLEKKGTFDAPKTDTSASEN